MLRRLGMWITQLLKKQQLPSLRVTLDGLTKIVLILVNMPRNMETQPLYGILRRTFQTLKKAA